jgi:hypothetical protein
MPRDHSETWDIPEPQLITKDGAPYALQIYGATVPISAFTDAIRREIEVGAQHEVDRWRIRRELTRELIESNYGIVVDAQIFAPGAVVTWHSQGGGRALPKSGVVVAYIMSNEPLSGVLPETMTVSQCEGEEVNARPRYLVRVSRVHKHTGEDLPPRYYTPLASVINRRNATRSDES